MKYIRTKDGIYELDKYKEKYHYFKVNGSAYKLQKVSECKQADTIEELIDEYVRVHKTFNNRSMICDKELAISSSKHPKHYDVYGSIWVDGELHKVAKMNEKGELELLWQNRKLKII